MKSFYFFTLSLLLFSCTAQKVEFSQIDFKADGCFGTCPIFTMTISGGGSANYNAKKYNEKQGEFNTVIKSAQLDSLKLLLAKYNLLSLKNEHSMDLTDLPKYTLTIKLNNGQTKTISGYWPQVSDKIKNLYRFIFSLRQTQNWK